MKIGIPKEIKDNEFRVSATPGGVYELISEGHMVFVQKDAGLGSGYSNKEYIDSGAIMTDTIEEVYEKSD
ncbi:unnamed protein product, partial [marine sediment metagenome]